VEGTSGISDTRLKYEQWTAVITAKTIRILFVLLWRFFRVLFSKL
jgi:hypothetical protein